MRAVTATLALVASLVIVSTLRAADATEGQESKHPPRFQNFGLRLDQLNLTDDQRVKVDELWKEHGLQLAEFERKMAAILTDQQRKARREAEQAAQRAGKPTKEIRQAVESATKATDEQEAKFAELRKEMAPLQQEIREKVLALLTLEQKEKLLGQANSVHGAAAPAEPPAGSPGIQPIESLWFISVLHFPGRSESDAILVKTLKEWQPMGVFDAFSLLDFPPTFADEKAFTRQANALIEEVGGRFMIFTLPVGKEGWESSANERLAKRHEVTHFDASKAMTQLQWLETLKDLQTDTWGWIIEQPARMPKPEQAARSAAEFVRFAKAQHKRTAIWLSAQALTADNRGFKELTKAICDATRADADYIGWMDLPGESLRAGESKWRETMAQVLDQILALSPKEKTVIQWLNNPKWPTKNVEGTKAYILICQAKGINRFQVLFPPQSILDRDPWREFYRTLPKAKPAATK
jgi:hypothetical protein